MKYGTKYVVENEDFAENSNFIRESTEAALHRKMLSCEEQFFTAHL